MKRNFHEDPVSREELIKAYLQRQLSSDLTEEWESHYLACQDCFEEIRASEMLIRGLGEPMVERNRVNDITVLRFAPNAQLLASSIELAELSKAIRVENDSKVLIDLSRVSRIDSTGLGVLMNCYCHALKNAGALKLLNAEPPVRRVLSVTKMDSVLPMFEDEAAAIASFALLS
jgi:anti-anti-sigma factor